MSGKGAFLISREIFENQIWTDVVKFRIFFYIVGNAVFSEDGVNVGGIHVKRGQFLRSYRNLADDLQYIENRKIKKYSVSSISRKVDALVKENRLKIEETELGTLFTVVNYNLYQGLSNYKSDNLEQGWNSDGTEQEQNRNNNKNVNNVNNDLFSSSSTHDQNFSEVMNFYQSNLQVGITETPYNLEQLIQLYDEFGKDILLAAMKLSAEQEKKGIAFLKGILNNWRSAGVKTLDDARKYEKEFRESRKQPNIIDIKGGKKHDPTDYTESVGDYGIKLYK